MTPNGKSPVMSAGQLAAYLQLSIETIYRMANAGTIPGWRITSGRNRVRAGDWRFNIEDIDRWRLGQSKGNGG